MIRIDEVVTEVVVEGSGEAAPQGGGSLDPDQLRELVRMLLLEELERGARTGEDR